MSAPQSHPRRRPIKATPLLSTHGMQLRKSGTFSSPKSDSSDICDLGNHHYMPRRSPTSTESLQELLDDSSVQRISNILKDFDRKIAGHKPSAASANILNDPEVLPVPSFLLDNASLNASPMEIDPKPTVERTSHDHASDSGLGSSVGESKYGRSAAHESVNTSVSSTHSAITRSFSALGAAEEKHTLGEFACRAIHDCIIKPILQEEDLKDFHPLIKDVPRRIGEKNICNLRDLEKTLIFLAPVSGIRYLSESAKAYCILLGFKELSTTPASYLRFCERSITLLRTTVDCLSEQDQRLPSDRPYTNNYFLDLVQQIHRYAAIMAATRRKEENGEELDEMDHSRDEKITLRGGLSHNGRPAELVREKNGKVIPIADGVEDAHTGFPSTKRALSDDEMDVDEITRSMARRRKSDKPGDVMHTCRDCKKEFKRPCDLTKHEKTHSRPWKCTEEKCKYFELGWPTEKERDRHVNDKHSSAPPQYKCLYPPCTYASKRESNCKQHMEKAHGWEYVRSKSNGRKKAPTTGSDRTPTTPLTPFLGTPQSATLPTPMTPFAPSPSVPMIDTFDYPYGFGTPAMSANGFQEDFRRDSVTTDGSALTYSSGHSPTEPTSFDDAVTPEDTTINHNDVFNNCGLGTNFNAFQQQPTPALSTGFEFEPLQFPINTSASGNVPHLSPSGQPDITLFSPQMHMDEGFGEGMDVSFTRPTEDFTLFGTTQPSNMNLDSTAGFFPDINQFGGQFDNLYAEPTTTLDDLMGSTFGNPQ
ncbi:hypothetical protein BU26DRAFT_501333 [Trematosphaeria pertusa]|uniref:C2H2-type domain-containing protein n=1 Tax=Trematosphaeria pertusa TaxID=390896 RepID=A0A6A6IS25_9PLEO|nr:uncharacterized protein BU26DRAFT_501333 [Trematosphaeria pertusa]KAF2253079.1 hypothetical protein BU26DRAFT_501333 [Trematosphaeria pertusa]